ncbi:unnamed protein product [Oikopleura dioica]|uniref:Uncharacterized protein n=1 Tax=Oikopleura dioica TaxID=34765 RepID=E4YNP4_OIKDI|nr:unnamed protein product [Oikopleura dioica]
MVVLTVKHGTDLQFLYECSNKTPIRELKEDLRKIYNGRLKIERIATEMEQLAEHGTILPENMQGLNESQVSDLKLVDPFTSKCIPSGGFEIKKDIYGRRNGQAPMENMAKILKETAQKAKDLVSKKRIDEKFNMTYETVDEALQIMKGAVMIVYPMDLPPYDPVRAELENKEDLSGQQASKLVIPEHSIAIWWANKELHDEKLLCDYSGKNDRTKLAVKIQKSGQSAPAREPVVSEEQQKEMMMRAYRRQEELKKLAEADDDNYMNTAWADSGNLKRSLTGMGNIKWGPR